MKRDFDMVRHILLAIDTGDGKRLWRYAEDMGGQPLVGYHLALLGADKYIYRSLFSDVPSALTEKGSALLEKIRDDDTWREIKQICADFQLEVFGLTIDAALEVIARRSRGR